MTLPELAIEVGIELIDVGAVKVHEVAPKEGRHQGDAAERGEFFCAVGAECVGQRSGLLRLALLKSFF